MKTKLWAIGLMVLITFIITGANLLYKAGVDNCPEFKGIMLVIAGLGLYGISIVFLIIAFKGGDLTILYPLLALSYIWISIASPILFPADRMTPIKWTGIMFIVSGISILGWGSK